MRESLKLAVALIAMAFIAPLSGAFAQSAAWPTKPVRVIVPYPPGGIGDTATRAVTARMAAQLGQPFIVENVPGGNQIIASQMVARSQPDGHMLLLASPTSMVLNPMTKRNLPYQADRMTAVAQVFSSPFFLITSPQLKASNVAELVQLAKANPGGLAYGSLGDGSSAHLTAELFAQLTGIRMTHVPYKGTAQSNVDLMSNNLQLIFFPGAGSLSLVKDGRLKALAVTSGRRSSAMPEVPTMVEAGVAGFSVESWWGLVAAEGTPRAVADAIAKAVAAAVADPALNQRFLDQAVVFKADTPAEFSAFLQRERALWEPLVRRLNIVVE
ncbi:MAG: tripartite tricarboxylate transporter substrate-binding protein [Burkholderiaceae bacterium]|nr:tripartite tricarboxylate transporter substrate-binding protein [Burkholderiaceae bacterium]